MLRENRENSGELGELAANRTSARPFDGENSGLRSDIAVMRHRGIEHELKEQLARELTAILDGYARDPGADCIDAHPSELSRLRHGELSRFSLARIVRYIARAGYDVEVSLKKTPRLEQRPLQRRPCSSVVRYDYYGLVTTSPAPTARRDG